MSVTDFTTVGHKPTIVHEEQATDVVVTNRRSRHATHNGVNTFQTRKVRDLMG